MPSSCALMASVETERLASFLRSRGAVVHEDLEFFARRASGVRGVFAVAPITRGTLLLRLPRSAVLAACDTDGDGSDWMPEAANDVSPILRTSLYLLRERALDATSAWAPYLETVPEAYDTLENWSPVEIERLRGTAVYDHLAGLRDASGDLVGAARLVYDKQIGRVVREHPDLWPDPSLGAFLRACAAVRTRGFHDAGAAGCGPYMLPARYSRDSAEMCMLPGERGMP